MLKFINFQKFILLTSFILLLSFFINGCGAFETIEERRFNDENFIILENVLSPNRQFRILIYQYDIGGLGYSRVNWAITPNEFENINLVEYELPDGYRTEGWTDKNELLISNWKPNYYIKKEVDIKTGDIFNGAKVKLIKNCSKFPLGKENCH